MKAEIFAHYSRILDNLIDRYDFAKYYFQNPFSFMQEIHEDGFKICCGATRGCIIENGYDWVVKYDLGDCGLNTCKKEVQIYEDAKDWGVENCFAEAIYLGTYRRTIDFYDAWDFDNEYYEDVSSFKSEDFEKEVNEMDEPHPIVIEVPLYGYPRANPFYPEGILDVGKVRRELGASPLTERNIVVGYEFAKAYDADEYELLVSFLEQEGVNDLHCNNVGTIAGKPVLIDYCGYEEDY